MLRAQSCRLLRHFRPLLDETEEATRTRLHSVVPRSLLALELNAIIFQGIPTDDGAFQC